MTSECDLEIHSCSSFVTVLACVWIILTLLAIEYDNFCSGSSNGYGTERSNSANTLLLNNITNKVSLTDEVNVSSLPSIKAQPQQPVSAGVQTDSKEEYLTRNYTKYIIAKKEAELIKPDEDTTLRPKVIEIQHGESLYNNTRNSLSKNNVDNHFRSSTVVERGFEGLSQLCCLPPDVGVATSSRYVMETVNSEAVIYNKTSGNLIKKFGLELLLNLPSRDSSASHGITDPVLLFDFKNDGSNSSNRWFLSISDVTSHKIHVAVSKTDDPTAIWRIYDFPFESLSNNCSDQPFVAVSNDKVVISVNTWNNNCNWLDNGNVSPTFRGIQLIVADKHDLVVGSQHVRSMQSFPNTSFFSFRPALILSPTTTLFLVTTDDFSQNRLQVLSIDGTLSDLHVLKPISISINRTDLSPDGIQPITFSSDNNNTNNYKSLGNGRHQSKEEVTSLQLNRVKEKHPEYLVHTGDARAQSPIWYNDRLWLALNVGCITGGDQIKRSCIRIIELDTKSSQIMREFDLGSRGSSLYYPALSVDKSKNNLGIIFGYSSSASSSISSHGTYPSLAVATAVINDKNVTNSLKYFYFLKMGSANAFSNRYGDYFSAALDPTESNAIWVAGQYYHYPSGAEWSTFIGKIIHRYSK